MPPSLRPRAAGATSPSLSNSRPKASGCLSRGQARPEGGALRCGPNRRPKVVRRATATRAPNARPVARAARLPRRPTGKPCACRRVRGAEVAARTGAPQRRRGVHRGQARLRGSRAGERGTSVGPPPDCRCSDRAGEPVGETRRAHLPPQVCCRLLGLADEVVPRPPPEEEPRMIAAALAGDGEDVLVTRLA
jgi:hypothetical protein